ncbi:unnamed protein product [Closterium sp. NIES-54]
MIEREDTERSQSRQSRVVHCLQSSTQAGQGGARLGWAAAGRAGAGWCKQQGAASGPQRAASGLQGAASGPPGPASGPQGAACGAVEAARGPQGAASGPQGAALGAAWGAHGAARAARGAARAARGLQGRRAGCRGGARGCRGGARAVEVAGGLQGRRAGLQGRRADRAGQQGKLVLGGWGPVVLTGHADASWVDDLATQQSSHGYTFSLGSGSVSWRSTRSSSVLRSSCEAKIYAGAIAVQELRWLTYLLTDLGERPRSPPVLYIDNKTMIALCQEHRLEHRTKHIALRYFLARELHQRGQLRLSYVATRAKTADIFTKALESGDHQRFCTVLGLVPTLPHLLTA